MDTGGSSNAATFTYTGGPVLQSATVTPGGDVALTFDKEMADPSAGKDHFTVTFFSLPRAITSAELDTADHKVIRLVMGIKFRGGQTVAVSFHTPDGVSYRIPACKVVRVQAIDHKYTVAVRFIDTDESLENQLVQSIFRMQLRSVSR
jgi:hypothetical protein